MFVDGDFGDANYLIMAGIHLDGRSAILHMNVPCGKLALSLNLLKQHVPSWDTDLYL
jgi:hypothetical protein